MHYVLTGCSYGNSLCLCILLDSLKSTAQNRKTHISSIAIHLRRLTCTCITRETPFFEDIFALVVTWDADSTCTGRGHKWLTLGHQISHSDWTGTSTDTSLRHALQKYKFFFLTIQLTIQNIPFSWIIFHIFIFKIYYFVLLQWIVWVA